MRSRDGKQDSPEVIELRNKFDAVLDGMEREEMHRHLRAVHTAFILLSQNLTQEKIDKVLLICLEEKAVDRTYIELYGLMRRIFEYDTADLRN